MSLQRVGSVESFFGGLGKETAATNEDSPTSAANMIKSLWDNDSSWACTNLRHVKNLVGRDPGSINRPGGTLQEIPLVYAVRFSAPVDIVQWMCTRKGIEKVKQIVDYLHGNTLLHAAVLGNSSHLLPYLLSIYPEAISVQNKSKNTPLGLARLYKYIKCLEIFRQLPKKEPVIHSSHCLPLRSNCIKTIWDLHGWKNTTLDYLEYLVRSQNSKSCLVEKHGQLKNMGYNIPLFWAVRGGARIEIVRWMYNATGTEVARSSRDSLRNSSLLHFAACENRPHLIPFLLSQAPESVITRDSSGATPLEEARRWKHELCIRLLIEPHLTLTEYAENPRKLFADYEVVMVRTLWDNDQVGWKRTTPEHLFKSLIPAEEKAHTHFASLGICGGDYGWLPICYAIYNGCKLRTVQWLWKHTLQGQPFWRSSMRGETLLHLAASKQQNAHLISFLINVSPPEVLAAKTLDKGLTPLELAVDRRCKRAVLLLRDPT